MSSHFAEDYFEARASFLTAAARAGLVVESISHPTAFAPNGAGLSADVARAGRADASHILFTVCGTHGVEGYAGSAAQVAMIKSGRLAALPSHVAVVFLHGLNPYGWSRDSQLNEDKMDINRNFIDHANPPQADRELIDRCARLMKIREITYFALGQAMRDLVELRDEMGAERFKELGAGQYVDPNSFKFGGTAPSWSNIVYRDIVRRYLSRATHIAELDWHTGLGRYGDTFPIFFGKSGSDEFEQTCAWWGRDKVLRGMSSWSADDEDSPAPEISGPTHAALVEELPGAKIAGGVVEVGTLPITQIGQVLFLDHWLAGTAEGSDYLPYWRNQMRTFMAPRDGVWERSVNVHARQLNEATLDGLISWDAA